LVITSSEPGFIRNLFFGTDQQLRPIVCALLYAVLAFWLLSADWVLGPVLERVANALHVRGLSPGTVAFFETINLATALLLTWTFARYENRRVDSYGLPVREAF
jgi:predicted MFS family arabinose efflux permease